MERPAWLPAVPSNSTRRRRRRALVAVLGTLAVSNVVANRVLSRDAEVLWNAGAGALLVGLARHAGLSAREIGLGRRAGDGLRAGALGSAAVAAVFTALAANRGTRQLFADERAAGAGIREAAVAVGVHIPLGTVVYEELAFRGVLPALLRTELSEGQATAVTAGLFGLWHVLPSQELERANEAMYQVANTRHAPDPIPIAVAATATAGLGLQLARRWGGHILAPILVHTTANALGYLISRVVADATPAPPAPPATPHSE